MADVLVVDDYASNRDLVTTLLRYRGHRALEAADGAEALAIVKAERPALVISDILMPTMDGFEFVRRLREDPDIAATLVIFYTAHYHEREARSLAKSCGVQRVLIKPAEPAEILAAIDESLSGARPAPAAASHADFDRAHLQLMTDKLSQKVAELQAANAKFAALTDLNVRLASERDPRALMEHVCRDARELIVARHAFVCVRDKADHGALFFAASGLDAAAARELPPPRLDAGALGEMLETRAPRRWSGAPIDPAGIGLPAGLPAARSALAVPIASLHASYGWICMLDKVGMEAFGEEDERMLAALAAQVGRIYENGSLYLALTRHAEELRESELRFRQLAENIREVFFLTTADLKQILYISPAFDEIWGRSREELYAHPDAWMEMIHPDDAAGVAARAAESGFEYQYRIVRDDGTVRWIHTRGFPIRDAAGKVYRIAGLAEDITQRVALESALRESEAGLKRAQKMARLAHVISAEDGSFVSWSESLPALIGYEEVPLTTRDWLALVDAADRDRFRDASLRAARTGEAVDLDYRLRRGDGEWLHIRQSMQPLELPRLNRAQGRWFSTLQDMSGRKRAADALRESERRFQDMLDKVRLVSVMLDTEARIVYCNDYLLELTGWRREELLGQDWFAVFIPPEATHMRAMFDALVANTPSAWHHENEILTRAGERRLVRWNNSVLLSADGDVVGTASIGEDVTQKRQAEDEVRRLNADLERRVADRTAQLEAANKELEAFDYSISHDLRAPLNRIKGFAAALGEEYGASLDEHAQDYLARIAAATDGMSQLVSDLLALSMVAREELRRVDVDVTAQAAAILEGLRKADSGRSVEVVVEAGMVARADPGLLRIVLENLLGNAWKFTSRRAGARIEVGMQSLPAATAYWVRDNGAGFDAAHASKLFAPFRRMHRAEQFKGTGIGLATVQRIIRRHGGRVWAEAAPGEGATFFFTLEPDAPGGSGPPA